MQLAEKTRSFAKPEEWRALHATLAELSATNRVSSVPSTELSNGYTYAEAISLEDAAMSACMTTHHLVHYKKEGIVLIIRKILTELRS